MAIIKTRKPSRKQRPEKAVPLDIPSEWVSQFMGLLPEGCGWNMACNAWLNEQYQAGVLPADAYKKCNIVYM